tara:strand:- start:39 stop:314 length:276 start_codon:yes stop_codon:yes gene_type:complete
MKPNFFILFLFILIILLTFICINNYKEKYFNQKCYDEDNISNSVCLFKTRFGTDALCTASNNIVDDSLFVDFDKLLNSAGKTKLLQHNNNQ